MVELHTSTRGVWREPATTLSLRWGSYRSRLIIGLVLAFVGGLIIQLTSAYSLVALPSGVLLHVVGWCILPGIGWRRVLGATLGALSSIMMLNGASSTVFLAVALGAWLFLRQRPLVSYLVLVIPAITAYLLSQQFAEYGSSLLVLSVGAVTIVGAAWLARSLAVITRPQRRNSL